MRQSKSIALGIITLVLSTCLSMPKVMAAEDQGRILIQLTPEEVKDTPENRTKYPFLIKEFDAVKNDANSLKDMPNVLPAQIYVVTIGKDEAKTADDLAFSLLSSPYYCGTAGCPFKAYALKGDGKSQVLRDGPAQIPNSFFLSICPAYTSILFYGGHGTSSVWIEEKLTNSSFSRINSYKDLVLLPTCSKQLADDDSK